MTTSQSPQASSKRQQEAAAWVLKNRDVNQSAHEFRAFEEWLDHDPENKAAYEAAERRTGDAPAGGKPRRLGMIVAIAIFGVALVAGALVLLHG
ncbi:FecR/PupR family sigma factor regulator [Nitrobacter sp.]|uniref:FecR/PupR family sigma factor regulator n=1 Tax=Nitrobacter sp. TaxID=29420 RepID=UPI003F65166F